MEISLCMIVKNEEKVLKRCLSSVKDFVDEIVIVDTGSIDSTKDIAREFNALIYDFKWCDDFSKARNYSFSKANKDYIFWLDADDYITSNNIDKLMKIKGSLNSNIDVVSMYYSLARDENDNSLCLIRRNRLLKKEKGYKWIGKVHEYIKVEDKPMISDVCICHDKDKPATSRNLEIFNKMKQDNQEFSARDMFYFANELYNNKFYNEAIVQYEKYLNDGLGWKEDVKIATIRLCECYNIIGRGEKTIDIIIRYFKYGKPNGRICCILGDYFKEQNNYDDSIFWYETALKCIPGKDFVGMDIKDYYTWIPAINLYLCYFTIGEYKVANYYNELAGRFKPDSLEVLHNRRVLNGLL